MAPCVSAAIELLQEKWVLLIVGTLLDGPRGFNDLGRDVGGCNPTTLAQRLARLERAGIVCKREAMDESRRVYCLTPVGRDLERVVAAIRGWAHTHFEKASQAA